MLNIEAEQSVISAVLIDNECYHDLADIIKPTDFSQNDYGVIWATFSELASKGTSIDLLTLWQALERDGSQIEKAFLGNLVKNAHSSANAIDYAKIIKQLSNARAVMRELLIAQNKLNESPTEANTISDNLAGAIIDITTNTAVEMEATAKELGKAWYERIDERSRNGAKLQGIPTGLKDLDNAISGLQKGNLILLPARPSMGKSTLALNIFDNLLSSGYSGIYCSMEMTEIHCMNIMCAHHTRTDFARVKAGDIIKDSELGNIFVRYATQFRDYKCTINYSATQSPSSVRAAARRHKRKFGALDFIFVDHIHLMGSDSKTNNENDMYTQISRNLKRLAVEMNCPVIALAQLNRELEKRQNKRPVLSDLRASGSLEQDANDIVFIYRDEYYNDQSDQKGIAELIIGKCRDGERGVTIPVVADLKKASFKTYARGYE